MELLNDYSLPWLAGLVAALAATGIVAGLLAGLLGVGGGIVIVPVLYHLFTLLGVDEAIKMHVAVGTSLATIIPTSFISAKAHRSKGNLDEPLFKSLVLPLFVGVLIGTAASGYVTGDGLAIVFGSIALLVAANMVLRSNAKPVAQTLPGSPWRQGIGTFIGGFSTLMGIGGGTLSVPILNGFNVPMHRAVGTAAAIGMVISIPGAIGFLLNGLNAENTPPLTIGYINLIGFALIVPATMWMAPIGANMASATTAKRLKLAFALFLAITAVRMLYGALS
ncbi:sulfite exporter TauE/SafE family protein [Limnobacter sp.]|uniref:sulfite exporter TauE/SafE family protein n=1 Tax=Limnobacter sp. TaxID=2003368 RepID=UPI003518D35F